jgi:hypothetical protein
MPNEQQEQGPLDPQEALRLLDDARGRLRTAIWALHGMHQDMNALTVDDIADIEHMLTEVLDNALTPAFDAVTDLLGTGVSGAVTTH